MAKSISVIVYPVSNAEKAKAFYTAFLGQEPYADSPYYIGYRNGDQEIGLDPNSSLGPIGYIDVDDIQKCVAELVAVGGNVIQDPTDVAQGLLVAKVKDTDGNVVGLRQQT